MEVDDNVKVAMTNEAQKEAGTKAFPSLVLSLARSLSLPLSFEKKKRNHRMYVCAVRHSLTSNENSQPITIALVHADEPIYVLVCKRNVCSFSSPAERLRNAKANEPIGWTSYLFCKDRKSVV